MESFSTVKSELRDRFDSCGEAKMELFDYIEVFYNQRRRHSTPGQSVQDNSTDSQHDIFSASEEDRTNGDQLTAHLH